MAEEIKPITTPADTVPATPAPAQAKPEQAAATPAAPAVDTKQDRKSGVPENVVYKLRAERRELRGQKEQLQRELSELKGKGQSTTEAKPELLDDPEKRLDYERQQTRKEALADAQKYHQDIQEATRLREEAQTAIKNALAHPDINGDKNIIDELDEIISESPTLSRIVAIDANMATEKAIEIWKAQKGIGAQDKKLGAAAVAATSTPPPNPMTSTPPRSVKDIRADLRKIDPLTDPDYEKKYNALTSELTAKVAK